MRRRPIALTLSVALVSLAGASPVPTDEQLPAVSRERLAMPMRRTILTVGQPELGAEARGLQQGTVAPILEADFEYATRVGVGIGKTGQRSVRNLDRRTLR